MWIGVISNTSDGLPAEIPELFQGMDFIIHCGVIGSIRVLEDLSRLAPVSGVLGRGDSDQDFPFSTDLVREMEGMTVYTSYKVGSPARPTGDVADAIRRKKPDVILFGDAKEPFNATAENCLWFSPGPSSSRRGSSGCNVGILELSGGTVRAEVVSLASAEGTDSSERTFTA